MLPKPYANESLELSQDLWKLEGYRAMSSNFIQTDALLLCDMLCPRIGNSDLEKSRPCKEPKNKRFLCNECQHMFRTVQGLNQHIGKVHRGDNKNLPCAECDRTFKHKYALKFHIAQVHEKTTRVACSYCDKDFYNKYELKKHSDKHHPVV